MSSIAKHALRNPKTSFIEALKSDSLYADGIIEGFRHQLEDYQVLSFFELLPMKPFGVVILPILRGF